MRAIAMINSSNKSLEPMIPYCAAVILKKSKMANLCPVFMKKIRKTEVALLLSELEL